MSDEGTKTNMVAGLIYLSRNGKTFGPFNRDYVDEIQESGELYKFQWIWDGSSPNWMPIDTPPPPPGSPPAVGSEFTTRLTQSSIKNRDATRETLRSNVTYSQEITQTAPVAETTQASIPSARPESTYTHISSNTQTQTQSPTQTGSHSGAFKVREVPSDSIQAIVHDHRSLLAGVFSEVFEDGCILLSTQKHGPDGQPFRKGGRVWLNLLEERTGRSENVQATVVAFMHKAGVWHYELHWQKLPSLIAA